MIKTIIFDLSEVLIAGMHGIEKTLTRILEIPEDIIIPRMSGDRLQRLFRAETTEDQYLTELLEHEGWNISPETIKQLLRQNFHRTVPGMETILSHLLAAGYDLILLSDNAQEWVEYLKPIHSSLLAMFRLSLFSFDPRLRQTKKDQTTFPKVLKIIGREAPNCLFIDDVKSNIQRATAVGIPSALFTTAQQFTDEQLPQFGIELSSA